MDQSEHIPTLNLQHVDEVMVVTSNDVATVLGKIPVLIGDSLYFDLEERGDAVSDIKFKCAGLSRGARSAIKTSLTGQTFLYPFFKSTKGQIQT